MYWFDKELKSEEVWRMMSYSRFRNITKRSCLYSESVANRMKENDPASENYDPLFKISPCWKSFFISSQQNKNPTEAMAIDECIIPLKV